MIQGIVGAFFVRIPVAYVMSKIEPVSLFRVGLATPSSTIVQIVICGVYLFFLSRTLFKKEETNDALTMNYVMQKHKKIIIKSSMIIKKISMS